MNSLLKSDVFFFITSIAVVIIAILLAVLIVYLIKVSRDIKYISQRAKTEADNIIDDVSKLRTNLKEQGGKIKDLAGFFSRFYKPKKTKSRKETEHEQK